MAEGLDPPNQTLDKRDGGGAFGEAHHNLWVKGLVYNHS